MSKVFFIVIIFIGIASAETNLIRVIGDRVSLRLGPSVDSELLSRAMSGEEFNSLSNNNGWVAIKAPNYIPAWVSGNWISNNIVTAKKLNVRIGPNLNYGVLGVISQGEHIEQQESFNNWIKITPPKESTVWISQEYTQVIEPEVIEPEVNINIKGYAINTNIILPELSLDLDLLKEQGCFVEYTGFLTTANPGLYQIVSDLEDVICLVRGREHQLSPLLNKKLRISGKEYHVIESKYSILQPEKISILPINSIIVE